MKKGVLLALAANVLWGLLPVYWKSLAAVPALQTLGHRIVWSFLFLGALMTARRAWPSIRAKLRSRRTLLSVLATSGIIALNWLTYLHAMNSGKIVEASLGYFLYPLVTVLLGFIFLRERLRPAQTAATMIAAAGVLYMTLSYGAFPRLSLILAFSFAFYSLLKKTSALSSLEGLAFETGLLSLAALPFLILLGTGRGGSPVFGATAGTAVLLGLTGFATAFPMILFVAGARRIPLAAVGFLNYVSSSLQFLLGAFVYREPFNPARWTGFAIIWTALAAFSIDAVLALRARKLAEAPA